MSKPAQDPGLIAVLLEVKEFGAVRKGAKYKRIVCAENKVVQVPVGSIPGELRVGDRILVYMSPSSASNLGKKAVKAVSVEGPITISASARVSTKEG